MIKHGTLYGYKKQGCRCDECTRAQRVASREYRQKNRDKINAQNRARLAERNKRKPYRPPRTDIAKIIRADRLLRDGASYAEAARTVGVSPDTVARWFPGRGWKTEEVTFFAGLHSPFNQHRI